MKKTGLTFLSVLTAGLLLSGCGSSGEGQNATNSIEQTGTTQKQSLAISSKQASALAISAQTLDDVKSRYNTNDTNEALKKLKLDIATSKVQDLQSLLLENKKANFVKKRLDELLASGEITEDEYNEFLQDVDLEKAFDAIMKNIVASSNVKKGPVLDFLKDGVSDVKDTIGSVTDKVTDKAKDTVVDLANTDLGNKATGAVFNVVLEDEGVTVFMLDQARNSETMTQIMIDALGNNWDLTKKMCPMLQENKEFGEKFAALAEEREIMAKFFFENIDANLYNCLGDAMLLSNDDEVHDESVKHSTTEYMGILMDRYSDFFVAPGSDSSNTSGYGRKDKFVSLMFDTGAPVTYDETTKSYLNHGDGNELANEKFFYALFKTPTSTDKFVSAMQKVDETTRKMLMDEIFLGRYGQNVDTLQGGFNIIAIGSGMYEGIYGSANTKAYGLASYLGAFWGFAGLIPSDRYVEYGKAFVNAGFQYAQMHGIDVWGTVGVKAQEIWNNYMSDSNTSAAQAPALYKTAGRGVLDSAWQNDFLTLLSSAWDNVSLTNISLDSVLDFDTDTIAQDLGSEYTKFIDTVIDGRDANGTKLYPTQITTDLDGTEVTDTVYGLHGLVELAIQEDIANVYYDGNITAAQADFTLPPFADITWDFVYNKASEGIVNYWDNKVNAQWLADLSDSELVKEYFYNEAYALYVPKWLLAFDWLKLPNNYNNTSFAQTDFNFQGGYVDLYIVSKNANLTDDADLATALGELKNNVTFEKVDMGDDSIIAVDENGKNLDGLYVYKLRLVSPEDVAAAIDYLSTLGSDALDAVGIDTSHATNDTSANQ